MRYKKKTFIAFLVRMYRYIKVGILKENWASFFEEMQTFARKTVFLGLWRLQKWINQSTFEIKFV